MPGRLSTLLALLGAALTLGAAGAGTAGAYFVASGSDPSGDAADGEPGHDIVAAALAYDPRSGELAGGVQLAAEPDAPALITVVAARRTATGCDGHPAFGFGSVTNQFSASWLRLDAPGAPAGALGDADKRGIHAAVQEFRVTDRRLAKLRPQCVVATLTAAGDASSVIDATAPIALVGKPALALRVRGVPKRLAEGRTRTLRVVVANRGSARTAKVRLKVRRARGMKATLATRTLRPLAPGARRTVALRVRLGARARTATDLRVTAAAGRLVARAEETLYVRRKRRSGSGGGGGGGGGGGSVCVRYFPDLSGDTGGSLGLVPC